MHPARNWNATGGTMVQSGWCDLRRTVTRFLPAPTTGLSVSGPSRMHQARKRLKSSDMRERKLFHANELGLFSSELHVCLYEDLPFLLARRVSWFHVHPFCSFPQRIEALGPCNMDLLLVGGLLVHVTTRRRQVPFHVEVIEVNGSLTFPIRRIRSITDQLPIV